VKDSYLTPEREWHRLVALKEPIMRRFERYASLTIPSLLLPNGTDIESTDQAHDYQSVGAQALNHITNKMMLAMFAPSRPIMRLDLDDKAKKEVIASQMDPEMIQDALAQAERDAQSELDGRGQRPKLFSLIRNLVGLGNCLMVLDDENKMIRSIGIRKYCVKRTQLGKMHTLVIREELFFDELADDVQELLAGRYQPESKVCHYVLVRRMGKGYKMYQAVNHETLPEDFCSQWASEEECPYHALTWNLSDEADYGTGLVEEYSGDLEALSVLSESIVDGAVLAAEHRYMVNPTSQTDADTFNNSKNGDALPGKADDITVVQALTAQSVQIASQVSDQWERRVSRGFLMASAVTRSAERVTAEEIRATAQELETALGGVYSSLAVQMQMPIARWLIKTGEIKAMSKSLKIRIITGLDALSRNGDLEALRYALTDAALINNLPEELRARLKLDTLLSMIGQGHGVQFKKIIKSEAEVQAAQAQAAQAQASMAGAEAGAVAQAQQGM
jgi:Bacteriophage head to tail connecting protein